MEKMKFFLNFDKEEKWLNEMAKAGWKLRGKIFSYKFEKAIPEETSIKIDYRLFRNKADYEDYKALFKDSGWEHIAGTRFSGDQYFKKITDNDTEDIFSDCISKAARYKRLSKFIAAIYFPCLIMNITLYAGNPENLFMIFNPKLYYLTPGLWEKTGLGFWGAFLFETPFALMRGYSSSISVLIILCALLVWAKAEILYYKAIKNTQ